MKRTTLIIGILAIVAMFSGCKKFLDVTPKTNLSEEQLFTSEVGFQQALSGVYGQLASSKLYGDNLSMGFVSALAQNYATLDQASAVKLQQTQVLNYASTEVVSYTDSIWSSSYSAIAAANKIIENTETNRSVLSNNSYALLRGEALALRAFLHFDLLRMFGPEYTAGANLKAIPYKKEVNQNANPPATTADVVKFALADLKEAESLLLPVDPIVTSDLRTRRNKLNYYGVKALEARIMLYSGDNAGAAAAATVVVNSGKYPFVTQAQAGAVNQGLLVRDRLYFNEQVFMIRVRDILPTVQRYFRFRGSASQTLTRSAANFATLYETSSGGGTDFRYAYRLEQDGGGVTFPSKFWQASTSTTTISDNLLDQYVPGIRLSEMYYILAETASTPAIGVGYLNTIRLNRGIGVLPNTITASTLKAEITKEYQKEFYAEGQLFFYYKRIKASRMQFGPAMAQSQYILPIPPSELQFNPNYAN
ncbi:RagB/SusD family nutrient uptake outer membrane protein [Pedobacter sp. WC2501]|uniref:RagB/SusD family nutrient uptake outer membrane protein n=1 Tax=Pedobacter alluvionis TaxID=475253 RepID=A0A497XTK9_9SPHI|nr:RagB/SusD family nutrient uptake outer membrane protein [Pedobacter alluvionis]RLJ72758.1 SusD-like starch-binding protein associating with outer membrane [Pedobacter alluvionis]TFB29399.1 RagB/SusD family nutrient uptake outer membrane protein [Pedobacter alluvionis]